jgi:maltose-binding protein MalE
MKVKVLKILVVSAAGILILALAGCGAKSPTTANDLSEDDQQKLTVSTEITTVGGDTELTVD